MQMNDGSESIDRISFSLSEAGTSVCFEKKKHPLGSTFLVLGSKSPNAFCAKSYLITRTLKFGLTALELNFGHSRCDEFYSLYRFYTKNDEHKPI